MTNTILHLLANPASGIAKKRPNTSLLGISPYFHLYFDEEKTSFLLNIIGAIEADYAYIIKDIHGNIFQKGEISTIQDDFQISIATPNITQGVYYFQLEAYDGSQTYLSRFFVNGNGL